MRAGWVWSSLASLASVGASACTQTVVFDGFTYDIHPCGSRPPACAPARDLTFVISDLRIPPASGRVRDGFDLDGTDEAICGQPDFVGPDGTSGVDNQIAPLLELYESVSGENLSAMRRAAHLRGDDLVVVTLRGVDDITNDDCVETVLRPARLALGTRLDSLDADGDGVIDPGVRLEVGPPTLREATGCIRDGVVHARFADALTQPPGFVTEVRSFRARARLAIASDRLAGLLGGGIPIDDLEGALPSEVVEFLRGRADLRPSTREARDCSAISWALTVEAVRAERAGSF